MTSGSGSLQKRVMSVTRPVLKATAAAITLGTGNSLGPEGPSVEIGRAAARGLGTVLKSKQRRLLSLVAAGSGAGNIFVTGCAVFAEHYWAIHIIDQYVLPIVSVS